MSYNNIITYLSFGNGAQRDILLLVIAFKLKDHKI